MGELNIDILNSACRLRQSTICNVQSTICNSLAEGVGVEPTRLFARRVSTALPSPIGWPFHWSRTRDSHPQQDALQTSASLLGLCDIWIVDSGALWAIADCRLIQPVICNLQSGALWANLQSTGWGDVPESNRRRLDHSQVSWPLDEHPHKSCGGRVRTFELRFQRPAFVPAQTTPHRMVPPRGLKPRTVRLEDACAVHLRHGGEWCIWRDSNSHCAGSKPAASSNWATDALVR
jgi:hypothetical protein